MVVLSYTDLLVCLFVLILPYFTLFYDYFLNAYLFSKKKLEGHGTKWDAVVKVLGGVRGGETTIRTYCMKRNLSSIKGKNGFCTLT